MVTISDRGVALALLDTIKTEDERRLMAQVERLRAKQAEVFKLQREARQIARDIQERQRQITAITDEMAALITDKHWRDNNGRD